MRCRREWASLVCASRPIVRAGWSPPPPHDGRNGRCLRLGPRLTLRRGGEARDETHPSATRDVPGAERLEEGRRAVLRRGINRPRNRRTNVLDFCRIGAQTFARRSFRRTAAHGAFLMGWIYLAALLVGIGCMLALDWRFQLFFFRRAGAATVVTVIGVAFFMLWDAAGIGLGIFLRGDAAIATGVVLAPEMPLEEPVFLTFLVLCTMVAYTGALRIIKHIRRRGEG